MKFKVELHNLKSTNQELLEDMIDVSVKLGKKTVTIDEYNKFGKYNSSTIQRRFKSWFIALEKAGLEKSRPEFNIEEQLLIENIEEVWIKLGKQPTAKDMKHPLSKYGANTYLRHFGSWNIALLKLGEIDKEGNIEEKEDFRNESNQHLDLETSNKSIEKRTISLRLRFNVFLRDGFRCQACGKGPVTHPGIELHCDHILPWSKGGKTIMGNLRTLCSECNLGKGNVNG